MKPSSQAASVVSVVAALVVASGTLLLANGESFFVPASKGPVNLVYFARVKNARTGRPIEKPPYVTIVDPYTGLIFPFVGDSPGHFRSPDIGAAIKEITTHAIDTRQLEIVVTASGYQTVKVGTIPRQSKGAIELNVRMEPKTNEAGAASTVTQRNTTGGGTSVPADSARPTILLLASCFGLAAIAAVARTLGRPASIGH
ncbi:MAG TPA: hypothetical protein VLV86_00895 [Vicinamibacterales bacterium]|nr:hypothetical protein [Vicinamibacterales bacterium]